MRINGITAPYRIYNQVNQKPASNQDSFSDVMKKHQDNHAEETFRSTLSNENTGMKASLDLSYDEYVDALARMALTVSSIR